MLISKNHFFKCDSRAPRAQLALDEHLHANPKGMPLYSGKSRNKVYGGYVIHETKTAVIVEEIK